MMKNEFPVPHLPPLASPLPPLKTRPRDLPIETPLPLKPVIAKIAEPAAFEVHQDATPAEPAAPASAPVEAYAIGTGQPPQITTDFAVLLGSASALRDAIILREIFGPPRSLRPLDLPSDS